MKMSMKNPRFRPFSRPFVPAVLAAAVLAACGGSDGDSAALNTKPTYLGAISEATYDGTSNDLLTAGLGATGLAQCYELTHQLRGTAGDRQVEGARVALQHNLGLGGACVVTLYQAA